MVEYITRYLTWIYYGWVYNDILELEYIKVDVYNKILELEYIKVDVYNEILELELKESGMSTLAEHQKMSKEICDQMR